MRLRACIPCNFFNRRARVVTITFFSCFFLTSMVHTCINLLMTYFFKKFFKKIFQVRLRTGQMWGLPLHDGYLVTSLMGKVIPANRAFLAEISLPFWTSRKKQSRSYEKRASPASRDLTSFWWDPGKPDWLFSIWELQPGWRRYIATVLTNQIFL